MDYQYKVIVSNQAFYKEFEIPADLERVKLGTTSNCEFRLNPDFFFEEIEIGFEKKEEWNILCNDNLYISRGDIRKLLFTELKHGDVLNICYSGSGEAAFELRFLIDFGSDGTNYSLKIDLNRIPELIIGDTYSANIELSTEYSKNTSVAIKQTASGVCLIEKSALYGTYVNGKRIEGRAFLNDYDFISVADFSAFYKEKQLYFSKTNIRLNGIGDLVEQVDISEKYPLFIRNTRAKGTIDEEKIKILDPDTIPTKPELNIVTSLMPTIAMFALVIILRGVMDSSGGTYVIFSVCSMGIGLLTSILNILNSQKKYKAECKKRRDVYLEYIENKKAEIADDRQQELKTLQELYYSTEEDLQHIESFSSRLFDRVPEDKDFLDVYIGIGEREAQKKIDYKAQEKLETGDDLCQLPSQLANTYKYIEKAPIVLKLKKANAVGIIGKKEKQYKFLENILIDIVSRQYFGDVNIYAFIDEDVKGYDWIKTLPHVQSNDSFRNIVCDNKSKNIVFEYLYKELTYRKETKNMGVHNVILILNEHGIKSHPISRFIENASELNTTFVFFEEEEDYLPLYCSQIIRLGSKNEGYMYPSANKKEESHFEYYQVPDEKMFKIAEILAPVYCEEISLDSSLRKNISLYELLGIYSANDLNLKERWSKSRIYDTMEVPLGVNVKNEVVYLNLHEKFHGPHGLVAGTTGSGKSEILQAFILSAATYFHPYEIGFVIIDFKGGGMVNQFKDLPHLIGAITNIDGKEIERSLKSIKAELLKRQNHFAEAGVNHIDKYIQLYKEGKVTEPLPHLVMIVDEFAELKEEQPDFMKELISTARIGRSLGVHLILATQKPSGVVDEQIWSNSKFKLCLKVQNQEDSNEVLKTPLAAEIKEPGRAYLQVGNNEIFELFQSAFSGAPATVDASETEKEFEVREVDFTGNKKTIYARKNKKKKGHVKNQLEAVVEYISEYFKQSGQTRLQGICLPSLEMIIDYPSGTLKESMVSIGVYDDPDNQFQGPAYVDFNNKNTLILGSSQYGKTNLLMSIIRSIAGNTSPAQSVFYILDFGSMVLKNFETLKHIGGVVCSSEDEKLKNLFKLMFEEIEIRKEKMLDVGVGSFASYLEAGYTDLPHIYLIVDNMTAAMELYFDDDDSFLTLIREGLAVGISAIVANVQTAGISYRYMSNFANRIAFYCNDSSEYMNLFDHSTMEPDEKPGRCIIEIEKQIYTCQTYLAFSGEKEIDRINAIKKFVEVTNSKYGEARARQIPYIPTILESEVLEREYKCTCTDYNLPIGLSYADVSPIIMNFAQLGVLGLCGGELENRIGFITYAIQQLEQQMQEYPLETVIIDDVSKELAPLKTNLSVINYTLDIDVIQEVLERWYEELNDRYDRLILEDNSFENDKLLLLLINNNDVAKKIDEDIDLTDKFNEIITRFKNLKVAIIFTNYQNNTVSYDAPVPLVKIRDDKHLLYFDEMDKLKPFDAPYEVIKANKKRLEKGDAFYIHDDLFEKVKLVTCEKV